MACGKAGLLILIRIRGLSLLPIINPPTLTTATGSHFSQRFDNGTGRAFSISTMHCSLSWDLIDCLKWLMEGCLWKPLLLHWRAPLGSFSDCESLICGLPVNTVVGFRIYICWRIKGVLLCSFTKSWFCFGVVLEHALMLGGSKIALFFT